MTCSDILAFVKPLCQPNACDVDELMVWTCLVLRMCAVCIRLIQQNLEEAAQQAAALGTPLFERAAASRPHGPLLALPSDRLHMLDPLSLLHCTALHLAALHGHAQVAQVLLTSPTCSIRSHNAEVRCIRRGR